MKRLLIFLAPAFIALLVFIPLIIFLSQKSGRGALQVTSIPKSKVYVNGKLVGQTPLCQCEGAQMLRVGDYTIRLVPQEGDFSPFEQKVTIYKSVMTVVDRTFGQGAFAEGLIMTLNPISDKNISQLFAITFPDKTEAFLDNSPVGTTPLDLKSVTDSDHELMFKKDGYKDKTIRVKTAKGFKLSAIVYLGINPEVATQSAVPQATSSAVVAVSKVLILNTPTGFLRVRETPSIASPEVARVNPGDTFDLVSEKEGWFEIRLNPTDGGAKTGWISSQYAKKQ
jgi:hypothetical protein